MPNLQHELDLAKKAVIKAGLVINDYYGKEISVSLKVDCEPVTAADKKADEIIRAELAVDKRLILSEESPDNTERLKERGVWIVDPLDGTNDFINRTGICGSALTYNKPVPNNSNGYLATNGRLHLEILDFLKEQPRSVGKNKNTPI